ncbi:MAG: type II secretion system protein [Planctomycetota bacterium]
MKRPLRTRPDAANGFTLAEAAVTIALVSIVLLMVVQGLQSAKRSAYYTKQRKTAYELAVGLLGEVKAGLYREELDSGMRGNFADQDEPMFEWEVVLGDEVFEDRDDEGRPFDNFADRRDRENDRRDDSDEDEDEIEEPFEKVKVRVLYPVLDEDEENEIVLESWVPWVEIYGEDEEDEGLGAESSDDGEGSGNSAGGGNNR